MTDNLTYSFEREPDVEQLQRLFDQTHWAAGRATEDIQTMLSNTSSCLTVWERDRLIGFARVITDGVYRGLLDDVVVDEQYRGLNVGREIVDRIVAQFAHLEELMLGCVEDMVPFYRKFGFEVEEHPHMALKDKDRPTHPG